MARGDRSVRWLDGSVVRWFVGLLSLCSVVWDCTMLCSFSSRFLLFFFCFWVRHCGCLRLSFELHPSARLCSLRPDRPDPRLVASSTALFMGCLGSLNKSSCSCRCSFPASQRLSPLLGGGWRVARRDDQTPVLQLELVGIWHCLLCSGAPGSALYSLAIWGYLSLRRLIV